MPRRAAAALALVALLWGAAASGCATVQPWQKEGLADPIMQFDEDRVKAGIQEHPIQYREGSTGATGAQGGGCGCG